MIRVLDKSIADKIAAGEVIDRPVSIVKELVENALDAGATSVVVEIKNGGKSYIRVTDDGCGIPAKEASTAFLRHATSKISSVRDLDSIETLGFRGEALASIAAVTRCELITKMRDSKLGTRLVIHGGNPVINEQTGCPDGTTLIITDLFYNTPARLKFMKSDGAESGLIIDFLSQLALAYKDVKFRLINNGKILFTTPGDGNRLNTIVRIYRDVDAKNMVPVSYAEDGLAVEGYISTPAFSKTSRGSQIYFVNGRLVNSKVMEKGVTLGYKERLFEGRYPIVYLFLTVDPKTIDVNIHPNKREVRFDDEGLISDFISRAIKTSLASCEAVVDAGNLFKTDGFKANNAAFESSSENENGERSMQNASISYEELFADEKPLSSSKVYERIFAPPTLHSENRTPFKLSAQNLPQGEQVDINSILSTDTKSEGNDAFEALTEQTLDKIQLSEDMNEVRYSGTEKSEEVKKGENLDISDNVNDKLSTDSAPRLQIHEPALKPFDITKITLTGVVFDTYITAVDRDNFYLIDQHAAHERIFYEKLVAEYDKSEKLKQPLIMPLLVNTSLAAGEEEYDWLDALSEMGFTIEEFGPATYRIPEIPMFMELSEAEDFVNSFIENIKTSSDLRNTVVIDKLIMMSCKAAIKANDKLSEAEMHALINDLAKCVNPFSCPHGRPTFIKLTRYEIEKMFKRV